MTVRLCCQLVNPGRQGAWIVNDTVRGNILFGKEFDQARYDEVVEACSLGHDFKVRLMAGSMRPHM